jgi:hypothetical protein
LFEADYSMMMKSNVGKENGDLNPVTLNPKPRTLNLNAYKESGMWQNAEPGNPER